jgi:hypothetical protein
MWASESRARDMRRYRSLIDKTNTRSFTTETDVKEFVKTVVEDHKDTMDPMYGFFMRKTPETQWPFFTLLLYSPDPSDHRTSLVNTLRRIQSVEPAFKTAKVEWQRSWLWDSINSQTKQCQFIVKVTNIKVSKKSMNICKTLLMESCEELYKVACSRRLLDTSEIGRRVNIDGTTLRVDPSNDSSDSPRAVDVLEVPKEAVVANVDDAGVHLKMFLPHSGRRNTSRVCVFHHEDVGKPISSEKLQDKSLAFYVDNVERFLDTRSLYIDLHEHLTQWNTFWFKVKIRNVQEWQDGEVRLNSDHVFLNPVFSQSECLSQVNPHLFAQRFVWCQPDGVVHLNERIGWQQLTNLILMEAVDDPSLNEIFDAIPNVTMDSWFENLKRTLVSQISNVAYIGSYAMSLIGGGPLWTIIALSMAFYDAYFETKTGLKDRDRIAMMFALLFSKTDTMNASVWKFQPGDPNEDDKVVIHHDLTKALTEAKRLSASAPGYQIRIDEAVWNETGMRLLPNHVVKTEDGIFRPERQSLIAARQDADRTWKDFAHNMIVKSLGRAVLLNVADGLADRVAGLEQEAQAVAFQLKNVAVAAYRTEAGGGVLENALETTGSFLRDRKWLPSEDHGPQGPPEK